MSQGLWVSLKGSSVMFDIPDSLSSILTKGFCIDPHICACFIPNRCFILPANNSFNAALSKWSQNPKSVGGDGVNHAPKPLTHFCWSYKRL